MLKKRDYSHLLGKKSGYVTAIEILFNEKDGSCLLCECVCGKKIKKRITRFNNGKNISCGCMNSVTHGLAKSPEYRIWAGMIHRCGNSNHPYFEHYGGRGITVCDKWLNSFESFISDMGKRTSKNHSLDRINNDGNYEPNNCRWATNLEQGRNTSKNVRITHNGKTQTLSEWCEELSIAPATLGYRLNKAGWDVEKALTTPVSKDSRFTSASGNSYKAYLKED